MRNKLLIFCLLITSMPGPALRADEAMWIPLLIEKYNIKLMQEKGFKLTAEDIYSVNKACMKDAVLQFGGGYTGEIISGEGLLFTNHHCGYGQLIGVNFDRAWEGVASDMSFNPDQSRNISLDIRYALFIIDKFAGAGYLLNEMTIVE